MSGSQLGRVGLPRRFAPTTTSTSGAPKWRTTWYHWVTGFRVEGSNLIVSTDRHVLGNLEWIAGMAFGNYVWPLRHLGLSKAVVENARGQSAVFRRVPY